jgi:hypothetical protein
MTEEQRAPKDRERVLREAEQLGLRVNADEGVTEYETIGPDGEPTLALHPLCALFPRMEGPELEEFAEDIRRNGQREPGTLYQSKIIDGGNRFQGCRITGRKFRARIQILCSGAAKLW